MTADYLVKKGEIKFAILLDICRIKKRQKFYLHKWNFRSKIYFVVRRVAQFGRALRSGRRGRGFESRHADIRFFLSRERAFFYIKKLNGCKEDIKSGFLNNWIVANVMCQFIWIPVIP